MLLKKKDVERRRLLILMVTLLVAVVCLLVIVICMSIGKIRQLQQKSDVVATCTKNCCPLQETSGFKLAPIINLLESVYNDDTVNVKEELQKWYKRVYPEYVPYPLHEELPTDVVNNYDKVLKMAMPKELLNWLPLPPLLPGLNREEVRDVRDELEREVTVPKGLGEKLGGWKDYLLQYFGTDDLLVIASSPPRRTLLLYALEWTLLTKHTLPVDLLAQVFTLQQLESLRSNDRKVDPSLYHPYQTYLCYEKLKLGHYCPVSEELGAYRLIAHTLTQDQLALFPVKRSGDLKIKELPLAHGFPTEAGMDIVLYYLVLSHPKAYPAHLRYFSMASPGYHNLLQAVRFPKEQKTELMVKVRREMRMQYDVGRDGELEISWAVDPLKLYEMMQHSSSNMPTLAKLFEAITSLNTTPTQAELDAFNYWLQGPHGQETFSTYLPLSKSKPTLPAFIEFIKSAESLPLGYIFGDMLQMYLMHCFCVQRLLPHKKRTRSLINQEDLWAGTKFSKSTRKYFVQHLKRFLL